MMKTVLVSALVALLTAVLTWTFFNREKHKIVYVDSIKLVAGYEGAKVLKVEYERKVKSWKARVDTLSMELSARIEKYEKEESNMSVQQKLNTQKLLSVKQEEFENYSRVVGEKIQKEDQRISIQVLSEITAFLKKYGQQNDYEFIMGATNMGNIVYAGEGTDVTSEVLAKLNKEYSK